MGYQPNLFGYAVMTYVNLIQSFDLCVSPIVSRLYYWGRKLCYQEPRAILLTYLSLVTSYADEYNMNHQTKGTPPLYWYPYWWVATVGYMAKRAVGVCNELLRQRYRDQTLQQSVQVLDAKTIEVSYEFKGKLYQLRLPIDRMYVNEIIQAEATTQDDQVVEILPQIKQLLGPLEDWHQRHYTPKCLGYQTMTLKRLCSDTFETYSRTFDSHEVLCPIRCIDAQKPKEE